VAAEDILSSNWLSGFKSSLQGDAEDVDVNPLDERHERFAGDSR